MMLCDNKKCHCDLDKGRYQCIFPTTTTTTTTTTTSTIATCDARCMFLCGTKDCVCDIEKGFYQCVKSPPDTTTTTTTSPPERKPDPKPDAAVTRSWVEPGKTK